jgi:DNA primase
VLFGLDLAYEAIVASRRAVVVEGYTDVMALRAAGVTTAVAVCGTAFGPAHAAIVRDLIGPDGEVVLCFDGDAAGRAAGERAKAIVKGAGLIPTEAELPDGRDPAEAWLELGSETLRALTGTA